MPTILNRNNALWVSLSELNYLDDLLSRDQESIVDAVNSAYGADSPTFQRDLRLDKIKVAGIRESIRLLKKKR